LAETARTRGCVMDDSKAKEGAFRLWRDGAPIEQIVAEFGGAESDQVQAWIEDWTRGAQGVWSADLAGPRRFRQPFLNELAAGVEEFVSQYTLWLIASRIALWAGESAELQQARALVDHSQEHLRRTHAFFQRHARGLPGPVQVILREFLRAADFETLQPTAEIFNRQMDDVTQLGRQLRHAIDEALA